MSVHPFLCLPARLENFDMHQINFFFNLVLVIFAKICRHMPVLVETVQQQQTLYMKTYVHLYSFGY